MTVFENLTSKNIDELAEWFSKYGASGEVLWDKWFDDNYCRQCFPVIDYLPELDKECECSWCEIHNKCRFFQYMDNMPSPKQVIKMWLESEV